MVLVGDTSSNSCFSSVMLVFRGVVQSFQTLFFLAMITVQWNIGLWKMNLVSTSRDCWKKSRFAEGRVMAQKSRWWFQIFFIFTPTWANDPI